MLFRRPSFRKVKPAIDGGLSSSGGRLYQATSVKDSTATGPRMQCKCHPAEVRCVWQEGDQEEDDVVVLSAI